MMPQAGQEPPRLNRKEQAQMYKQSVLQGQGQLEKEGVALTGLDDSIRALNEWDALNKQVMTGPILGGRHQMFTKEFQRMQQLERWFQANMFKPGQGQISNFERDIIKESFPSRSYNQEANAEISLILKGAAQTLKDRHQFRELYLQQNPKGSLLGADKKWADYVNANPRYIRNESGAVIENPDFQPWYAWDGQNHSPKSTQDPRKQAIEAELRRRGVLKD